MSGSRFLRGMDMQKYAYPLLEKDVCRGSVRTETGELPGSLVCRQREQE
jgi:hypothetical protein